MGAAVAAPEKSVVLEFDARGEAVLGAAVRALRIAVVVEIEEDARVRGPQRHCRIRAVCRQVFGLEFHHRHRLLVHLFFSMKGKWQRQDSIRFNLHIEMIGRITS
jgi:hypothetical protein